MRATRGRYTDLLSFNNNFCLSDSPTLPTRASVPHAVRYNVQTRTNSHGFMGTMRMGPTVVPRSLTKYMQAKMATMARVN